MSDQRQPSLAPVARKPTATAILTAVVWNAAIAVALGVWFLIGSLNNPPTSDAGENWTGVIILILVAIVGTAMAVGATGGAVTTAILVGRRLRRASAQGQPGITTRTAILLGTAGTGIGWLIGIGAAALVVAAFAGLPTLVN